MCTSKMVGKVMARSNAIVATKLACLAQSLFLTGTYRSRRCLEGVKVVYFDSL